MLAARLLNADLDERSILVGTGCALSAVAKSSLVSIWQFVGGRRSARGCRGITEDAAAKVVGSSKGEKWVAQERSTYHKDRTLVEQTGIAIDWGFTITENSVKKDAVKDAISRKGQPL